MHDEQVHRFHWKRYRPRDNRAQFRRIEFPRRPDDSDYNKKSPLAPPPAATAAAASPATAAVVLRKFRLQQIRYDAARRKRSSSGFLGRFRNRKLELEQFQQLLFEKQDFAASKAQEEMCQNRDFSNTGYRIRRLRQTIKHARVFRKCGMTRKKRSAEIF